MADSKGAYGTVHVMEEEMRAAGQGVFEDRSSESRRKRTVKAEPATLQNKAEAAPVNKSSSKRAPSTKK